MLTHELVVALVLTIANLYASVVWSQRTSMFRCEALELAGVFWLELCALPITRYTAILYNGLPIKASPR